MARNPVMFVVEVGAVFTTALWIAGEPGQPGWFAFTVAVLAVAHGRSSATSPRRSPRAAARPRPTRCGRCARRRRRKLRDGTTKAASELTRGDVVVVEAGELIPGDGTVVEGIASVDESAITGESAPVIRESGGDRSAVTGGTRVLSDRIVVEITQEPGQSFLDRMIALVEGAERRKTPNEIALVDPARRPDDRLPRRRRHAAPVRGVRRARAISITNLIALLVALIPTTIGALLSAIGIAGMDRLVRRNVLALSGRAVEASGDVDVLLLDKTGTITLGNRQAAAFVPMPGVGEAELAEAAQMSLAGRRDAGGPLDRRAGQAVRHPRARASRAMRARFVPFTAQTRMSGVDVNGTRLRKGAGDAILRWVAEEGGQAPPELQAELDRIGARGRDAARRRPRQPGARRRSSSRTSSRRACASASSACARWASAPSWSPATTA